MMSEQLTSVSIFEYSSSALGYHVEFPYSLQLFFYHSEQVLYIRLPLFNLLCVVYHDWTQTEKQLTMQRMAGNVLGRY